MNVLMYPLGPEDDFPDEFCAIRQGSGEHWFYTPEGESASWMLFRALADNAKLRELAERAWKSAERLCQAFDGPCRDDGVTIAKPCPMGERDEECVYGQLQRELRECGVEVGA